MSDLKAAQSPCQACPWRVENHGVRTPDGWYTKANLKRLWNGLRSGEAPGMSCHPTDPRNPLSDEQKVAGYKEAPGHSEVRECAGSVILMQRELMLFQEVVNSGGSYSEYRRQSQSPMRKQALLVVAMRASGLPTFMTGGAPMRQDHDLTEKVSM